MTKPKPIESQYKLVISRTARKTVLARYLEVSGVILLSSLLFLDWGPTM